jgi:putative molybdopterin biosynthesis protein
MDIFQNIRNPARIDLLGDPRRQMILRTLMTTPATLSQLGEQMDMHPAKVRYHLKKLEEAGFIELERVVKTGGYVEKFYSAAARALLVNFALLPYSPGRDVLLALGSHDMALELLASMVSGNRSAPEMITLPLGSLDGLFNLRQGIGQIAGCHLYDPPSGEYNLPYVKHVFPDQAVKVINLVRRQQGLLVQPGNPHGIRNINDLAQPGVRFVNRKKGSGTRLWLDQQLKALDIDSSRISGYDRSVNTHTQVAGLIASGQADVGLAILAAAQQFDLNFIPIMEERFDLVIPEEYYQSKLLAPALDCIHSGRFRREVQSYLGYQADQAGRELTIS